MRPEAVQSVGVRSAGCARQCTRTKTIYREVLREVSLYLHLCLALASAQARAGSSELDVELAERAPHRFGSLRRAPRIPQAKWGKMCVPPGKVGTLLSPRQSGPRQMGEISQKKWI